MEGLGVKGKSEQSKEEGRKGVKGGVFIGYGKLLVHWPLESQTIEAWLTNARGKVEPTQIMGGHNGGGIGLLC